MQDKKLNLEAPWEQVKELIKEHEMELTDEDLQYQPEKEDELYKRLQKKLKKSPQEIKAWIESISHNTGRAG